MAGRRPLLAGVAAVLLAVSLAACGKSGETTVDVGPGETDSAVAAVVNGEPIYVSDVDNEGRYQGLIEGVEKLEVDSAEFNDILDDLIQFKLLAQEAETRGLDQDPLARHRLASARETILGNILKDSITAERVDEAAIKKMYERQIAIWELGDEAHVRHIQAQSKDAIDKVAAELKKGIDFSVLASRMSTDTTTKMEGGDLGYMKADEATPEFAKVIRDTPTGGVSKPFETEAGWHIVKIDERRKEQPPSLEELREPIVQHLTRIQLAQLMKQLQSEAKIEKRTSPRNSTLEIDPFDQPDEPKTPAAAPAPQTAAPPADARDTPATAAKPAPAPTAAKPAATPAATTIAPAKPPVQQIKPPAPASSPAKPNIAPAQQPSGPVSETRPPT
ncbi:MAG TPA: peptidylprolyl isomerase [Hyphomonadaceae bacterium]|nr:peptidylprolyl isomerase [Hyphomonadaceae bacterium]